MRLHWFIALFSLLLLPACDGGGPEPPGEPEPGTGQFAPLAGTWESATTRFSIYLVPPMDGRYPDLTQPGEGGIVLSGAVEDTLRYMAPYKAFYRGESLLLHSRNGNPPFLDIIDDRWMSGWVRAYADDGSFERYPWDESHKPYPSYPALSDGRLVFEVPWVFTHDDGTEVTATGALTFATRAVTAGDPALYYSKTFSNEGTLLTSRRYEIDEDGNVVWSAGCGDVAGLLVGTVERGTIQFAPLADNHPCEGAPLATVRYEVDGEALAVTAFEEVDQQILRGFNSIWVWGRDDPAPEPIDSDTRYEQTFERVGGS